MKTRSINFLLILSMVFFGFSSCSDDDDSNGDEMNMGCGDFESEWTEAMEALSTYSDDPTPANCENYKTALMDFYREYEDCAFWGDQYQEAIDEIQEMDCSEIES